MNKTILITGATRGLGANLARQFAARGYQLALTGRNIADLEMLQAELQSQSPKICIRQLDVTDFDSIAPVLQECAKELGGIDIVVANAGIGMDTPVGEGHFANIRKIIDLNITGSIATCDAAVVLFRQQGQGQIVGISSIAKLRGMPKLGVYSASKAAFSMYLESLRCDTYGENIKVTELAPGIIDTEMNQHLEDRPFLITVEEGTRIMADQIEKGVKFRYAPSWPWVLFAQLIKVLPISLLRKM